jgi:hypothetical protein
MDLVMDYKGYLELIDNHIKDVKSKESYKELKDFFLKDIRH